MIKKVLLALPALFFLVSASARESSFTVVSPGGNTMITVSLSDRITYSISFKGETILEDSAISLSLTDGTRLGTSPVLMGSSQEQVSGSFQAFAYKRATVQDHYGRLVLQFEKDFAVEFRAYDDGAAYRFLTSRKKDFCAADELAEFHFPAGSQAYVGYVRENGYHPDNRTNNGTFEEQFFKSFVNSYKKIDLKDWESKRLAFMPLLVETPSGARVCLTEADLLDYPGMYLNSQTGDGTLRGVFAPCPKTVKRGGASFMQEVVVTREDYIATCKGESTFPWRTFVLATSDKELPTNDMVYRLASPSRIDDLSWIKPGKAAWEWWSSCYLEGVDFEPGVNTDTYEYFIRFAAENGLPYLLIDAGWYEEGDIYKVRKEVDLKRLVAYADSLGVGIILWTGSYPFMQDIEGVCRHYSHLGIKGFKIDYMDRDDQWMVRFHREASEIAAKYKLVLDFHGTYKPTGLNRTYPNVLNFEAVQGLEHMKWAAPSVDQVGHDVTIPFIRMVAGPMDYTPGAMQNASREKYRPNRSNPMSQGTRCRQMAEYVIFDSPLSMMCDSPTRYLREQECTSFISSIPDEWDESEGLDGQTGKYIALARRKGNVWYVAAMNDWEKRDMELDLSFLGEGIYHAMIFRDAPDSGENAEHYERESRIMGQDKSLSFTLAPGGGYVARLEKVESMLPEHPVGFGHNYKDRDSWDRLYASGKYDKTIALAETILEQGFPKWDLDLYNRVFTHGDTNSGKLLIGKRLRYLSTLVWAECLENKGRFTQGINDAVYDILAQNTWVNPRNYSPRNYGSLVELATAMTAQALSQTVFLLDDKLSPQVREDVLAQLYVRAFNPLDATLEGKNKDHGWLASTNNWNAVCLEGVVCSALTMIPDRSERAKYIAMAEKYIRSYVRGFLEDGYCSEGISYYNYGMRHYITLREKIVEDTHGKVDLFDYNPKIRNIATFLPRMEIVNGVVPTIADCGNEVKPSIPIMNYLSKTLRLGLPAEKADLRGYTDNLFECVMNVFPRSFDLYQNTAADPFTMDWLRSYFSEAGVMVVRTDRDSPVQLGAVLKGGHNKESHNHNDVGSYTLVMGDRKMVEDPGSIPYTIKTFGAERYTAFKTLSSYGHPVPLVAGKRQEATAQARATVLEMNASPAVDIFKIDYAAAYDVPELETLVRTCEFDRKELSLTVTDEFAFSSRHPFETAVTTRCKWKRINRNAILLENGAQRMKLTIEAPKKGFSIKSEKISEGGVPYTRLSISLPDSSEGTVTIKYSPL